MIAVAGGLALLAVVVTRVRPRLMLLSGAAVAVSPLLGIAAIAGSVLYVAIRRARRAARDESAAVDEELLTLDILALSVASGLPFITAALAAAEDIREPTRSDLRRGARHMLSGLAHGVDEGILAGAFDLAARSAVTGVPIADELKRIATQAREDESTRRRERLARLPVVMLFPLAFLILPGFVLIAVVPALVGGLAKLTF